MERFTLTDRDLPTVIVALLWWHDRDHKFTPSHLQPVFNLTNTKRMDKDNLAGLIREMCQTLALPPDAVNLLFNYTRSKDKKAWQQLKDAPR